METSPSPNGSNGEFSPSPNGSNGEARTARGRFARGNRGGPGNPYARRTADFRKAILDAVDVEGLARIFRRLAELAEEGDVAAAKLILSYLVGPPTRPVDPDRLDRHELEVLRDHPSDLEWELATGQN